MADDNGTVRDDSSQNSQDPLGIIGWVIGGKYKVESYISGGGFGEVYAGYNQHLTEQKVVIKFFKRVQSREKFDKEARILCQLDHPNISRVIDYLPDEGAAVVAFIDGQDGGQILKAQGKLSEKLLINVAKSMTKAIAYAHGKKIAHRDLKPGNILIDKNEHVYLIDFGIAKEIGGDATKTAYTALTPMFAAPERQSGDKNYNPFLSDIYEMGITLFNFATNSLPYRNPVNPNFGEWGGRAADHLAPELRRMLLKATHPNPEKRYQSAAEMADDFDKLTRAYGPRRTFPVKTLMAALIVIAIGIAAWQFGGDVWNSVFNSPKQTANEQNATESNTPPPPTTTETPSPPQQPLTESEPPPTGKPQPIQDKQESTATTPQTTTPPAEQKPAQPKPEQPKPEQPKPEPAKITKSEVVIKIAPSDIFGLWVDNIERVPNQTLSLPVGKHEIKVLHPEYPVYQKQVTFSKAEERVNIDLIRANPKQHMADIQLALSPPSDAHLLELTFNGKKQTIISFPALDIRQPEGKWQVELKLKSLGEGSGDHAHVDSCVIFPYGGGPKHTVKGGFGILQIGSDTPGEFNSVPIVVFWSK